MASRHQRTRTGASSERARGICRPATTRAQALRQAKSAAIINSRLQEAPGAPNPRRVRTGLARVGAPPLEPKRLEFSKPGVTKAMMARMQHVQKLKEAEEQKRRHEEAAIAGRPRRTAAPPGGDARLGREKSTLHESRLRSGPSKMTREDFQQFKGNSRRTIPDTSGRLPGSVSKRRHSLGQRSTVVDAANRSIQVIQETLDEQDIAECLVVQNKLQDLQNARRDFVLAIANVSSNAVSFADDLNTSSIPLPGSPLSYQSGPLPQESPSRFVYKLPDVDDSYLNVDIDRHQAVLANARQFLDRREEAHCQREAQRRIDEQFARVANQIDDDDFRYDIPLEQDIMEGDVSFEEDEDGTIFPCQSRIKASMPPIPRRNDNDDNYYNYATTGGDIDDIERFFDTTNYPVVASSRNERRKYLHPDFLDLEDPWYRECPTERDLMEFDLMEFSK
ncbi:uncharacterized protein LOC122502856 [Leptopilina heterotoma]|uniref:uncharacterized protein LOC122502856 n=1 Tax=Leptopilina heterotoma TaxID=63436 RepID=UPI001CAA2268|nr:uncharacterized protein LOC122502856 [Leptopilina heterotoma]